MIPRACHSAPEPFALRRASGEGATTLRVIDLLGLGILLLTACASPEAIRTRGGGPGADVRNWGEPVELHAGAHPYHGTPCVTEPVKCTGPLPVFGPTPPPD
jgi:hypothetical protein